MSEKGSTPLDRFTVEVHDLPIAAIVVDRHGIVSDLNDQFSSRIGYSRADIVGKPVSLLVPERVRDRHDSLIQSFFDKPTVRAMGSRESRVAVVMPSGQEVRAEIALYPCEEDDCVLALVSLLSEEVGSSFYRQMALAAGLIFFGIGMEVAREALPALTSLPDGNLVVGAGAAILAHLGFVKNHSHTANK